MSRKIISVPVSDELNASLMKRAEQLDRPVAWVAREALRAWLASGGHERQVEYRGGESRVERDYPLPDHRPRSIPDVSAEDVGLGPPPCEHSDFDGHLRVCRQCGATWERISEAAERRGLLAWFDAKAGAIRTGPAGGVVVPPEAPKSAKLAAARAALATVPTRRGFMTKEIRPGLELQVPTGESYVEYDGEALRASKRAGDQTGRG